MILKQTPEDFKVTEIITPPKKEEGKYTYFWLTKTNYTTVRAINQIARALRISKRRLHFAGTKDKNAITKQLVSVMYLPLDQLKELKLKDIEIEPLHTGKERVTLGMHTKNRFEIVVRDVKKIPSLRSEFPNYFDEQRFSSNNAEVGEALLKGFIREAVELILSKDATSKKLAKKQKWSELVNYYDELHSSERTIASWLVTQPNDYAGAFRNLHKKIRMLYIHAVQSLIFNSALSDYIKEKGDYHILELSKDLKLAMPHGTIHNEQAPLVGYKTKLGTDMLSKKIKNAMRRLNIKTSDFKCAKVPELASGGNMRDIIVKANNLKLKRLDSDSVKVSFDLPKGCYATLLIKILFDRKAYK